MATPRRNQVRRPTATRARAKRATVLDARPSAPLALRNGDAPAGERLDVRKTYKLFIGGAFPRTESGRSYLVHDAAGRLLANACRGTRKDIRDAVRAARAVQPEWASKTAFNRSQILYRIAELMEGRRDQFVAEDFKGVETKDFLIKEKLFKDNYPGVEFRKSGAWQKIRDQRNAKLRAKRAAERLS